MENTASAENFASEDESNAGFGGSENRERDRERRNRNQKGTRFSDADKSESRDRSREGRNCRIYVSNIPYDYRWQDLKDLFRRVVGSVEYVELFQDENGKARGCGIVEFKDPDNVEKALEKMNRYDINGREIVVKEDHGENRDQCGRIIKDGMSGGNRAGRGDRNDGFQRRGNDKDDMRMSGSSRMSGGLGKNNVGGGGMLSSNAYDVSYNTYGLSSSFLESLGIFGPLHTKIFVANLDYKVDNKKLKQVFKLAGRVQSVDLSMDKEGNSRGFAVVEYEHPVEAVQAISMFDCQMLYERRMTVRLDRIPDKTESLKLPDGLGGIGIGLGPNGEPLRDVAKNLPNIQQPSQIQETQKLPSTSGTNMVQPVPVAPPPNNQTSNAMLSAVPNQISANMLQGLSESNLVALSNALGVKNLSSLSNPLLNSSLSSLGLNLPDNSSTHMKANIDESINSSLSSNNYNSGNNYSTGYSSTTFSSGNSIGRTDYDNNSTRKNFNSISQPSSDFGATAACMFGGAKNTSVYQSGTGATNGGRKSDTIIIRNIPISCTWQTLRDKFRDIGEVKFAEIRGNDVGVVRFFKENDAELAIKIMDGSRIEGRTVSVTFF